MMSEPRMSFDKTRKSFYIHVRRRSGLLITDFAKTINSTSTLVSKYEEGTVVPAFATQRLYEWLDSIMSAQDALQCHDTLGAMTILESLFKPTTEDTDT